MTDNNDNPKRDWFYWLYVALFTYATVTQLLAFVENGTIFSLVTSIGSALFAIGLLLGWPLRRKGEHIASMPRPRAIGVALSILGVILFTVGGLWHLAAR
jgi:hypothetical protein